MCTGTYSVWLQRSCISTAGANFSKVSVDVSCSECGVCTTTMHASSTLPFNKFAPHARDLMAAAAAAVGFAFARDKRQPMSYKTDFLGIEHKLYRSFISGCILLAPRDRLAKGTVGLCLKALESNRLSPGEASTLCGKLQFMSSALFNKVGRVGLRSVIQRIYVDRPPSLYIAPCGRLSFSSSSFLKICRRGRFTYVQLKFISQQLPRMLKPNLAGHRPLGSSPLADPETFQMRRSTILVLKFLSTGAMAPRSLRTEVIQYVCVKLR